jgi:hypothetical protein
MEGEHGKSGVFFSKMMAIFGYCCVSKMDCLLGRAGVVLVSLEDLMMLLRVYSRIGIESE